MNLFFDTSALVKLFHQESGSAAIAALVELDDAVIWVSELARVEFVNALHRRVRMHELDEAQMEEALLGFAEAWETFRVEPLGTGVLREAELFIKKYGKTYGLRTLDALHLATFSLIAEPDWRFVVADKMLGITVKTMGFEVINPVDIP